MGQSAQETVEVVSDTTIYDMDVHLRSSLFLEKEAEYYMDEPHLSRLQNTEPTPVPSSGWNRYMDGRITRRDVGGPEDIKEFSEKYYIDHPVINTASYVNKALGKDFAISLMRGANDHLLDSILDDYDDFKGLATLSLKKPDKAAEELDRLGDEDQIVGAYIVNTGPLPPEGDESYDVMYQAAEDNDLQIVFHSSSDAMMIEFPRQNYSLQTYLGAHTLSHPWSHMKTLTSLTENGTFEKFPDLNFVFLEAGVSWVPYMMFRLNKEYGMRRSEIPLLEKSPEEYIRESCYFASQPIGEPNNPEHLANIIDALGPDSLMFATDYPHWDFDNPEAVDKYLRRTFSEEGRNKVLHGNAEEIFDV